jgi:ribosomal protein S19
VRVRWIGVEDVGVRVEKAKIMKVVIYIVAAFVGDALFVWNGKYFLHNDISQEKILE